MGNPLRRRSPFGMSAVTLILILNISVFVFQMFNQVELPGGRGETTDRLVDSYALKYSDFAAGKYYLLLTHMFLHGGFWHLLFNMWGLYMFGQLLESRIGTIHFLNLYFLSGLLGGGFWILSNVGSPYGCIGASGAVSGVIMATAMFYPNLMIMLIIPPIPMKLKTFAIVFVICEMLLEFSGGGGNIAHLAHLGGVVGGWVFVKLFYKDYEWDILSIFKRRKKRGLFMVNDAQPPSGEPEEPVSQKELDRILDKISHSGINSLSEEEMALLRKAREQMLKGRER